MHFEGSIRKMRTELKEQVQYYLSVGNTEIYMNNIIGSDITITYNGVINCIKCGIVTSNSFAQGYCYNCFITAPETEDCVLRPELCRAHEGIARNMEYAGKNCLIEHYVYLTLSPGIKVGVTRYTQVPTRWIDQGAAMAIILAKTPNRYKAGLLEVALKDIFSDKTNWKQMLAGKINNETDLHDEKWKAEELMPSDLKEYFCSDDKITAIAYPVLQYPTEIESVDLDQIKSIKGRLTGIKGQYLIFETGEVINIRKYGGYNFILETEPG